MSEPTIVRWRLLGNETEPTSRIRGSNVYKYLLDNGIDAGAWDGEEKADIIILQYHTENIDAAKNTGATVVFDCNDMVFAKHHKYHDAIMSHMGSIDAIVAGTKRIQEHLENYHKFVTYIPDAVESEFFKISPVDHEGTNLIWIGMHDNIEYFRSIDGALEKLSNDYDFTMTFICPDKDGQGRSNIDKVSAKPYNAKHITWSQQVVYNAVAVSDIALTPLFNNEWCFCKGANKAGLFMAAKVPTVAPAHYSYKELIEHGKSGMLAYTEDEWYTSIKMLLDDEKLRKNMASAGRRRAKSILGIDSIGKQWAKFIDRIQPPK